MGILKTAKDIVQGWTNVALDQFDLLDEDTKKIANERANICDTCFMRTGNKCDPNKLAKPDKDFIYNGEQRLKDQEYPGCACGLSAKTLSPDTQCPLNYWITRKMNLNGTENKPEDHK